MRISDWSSDVCSSDLLIGDKVTTFAELDAGMGRLASWLLEQAGGPGERVASWSAKTRLACLMPLVAARAGLIHVPVNPLLKGAQEIGREAGRERVCPEG